MIAILPILLVVEIDAYGVTRPPELSRLQYSPRSERYLRIKSQTLLSLVLQRLVCLCARVSNVLVALCMRKLSFHHVFSYSTNHE